MTQDIWPQSLSRDIFPDTFVPNGMPIDYPWTPFPGKLRASGENAGQYLLRIVSEPSNMELTVAKFDTILAADELTEHAVTKGKATP